MTNLQVELLLELIEANQRYRSNPLHETQESRLVEVGWINGVSHKTAASLVAKGLATYEPGLDSTTVYVRLVDKTSGTT